MKSRSFTDNRAAPAGPFVPAQREEITVTVALLILLVCLVWGGAASAIKVALRGLPPLALAFWRLLLGLACLFLWCSFSKISWRVPTAYHLKLIGFAALIVLRIGILNYGMQFTSSNHAVVFINSNPLFVGLMAHFLIPGDQLNFWKRNGLLLAFLGLCIVFFEGSGTLQSDSLLGDSLVLTSGFLLALDQIYAKFLVRDLNAFQIVFWQMVYAIPLFLLLSTLFESATDYRWSTEVAVALGYQAVFATAFCFVGWNYLLQHYPASKISAYRFSIPLFGTILSWLVLGEKVSGSFALGVGLVGLGIYWVSKTRLAHESLKSSP